jgi:hypothetical protein
LLSRQRHSAIDIEDNSGIGVKVAIKLMIRINAGINHLRRATKSYDLLGGNQEDAIIGDQEHRIRPFEVEQEMRLLAICLTTTSCVARSWAAACGPARKTEARIARADTASAVV